MKKIVQLNLHTVAIIQKTILQQYLFNRFYWKFAQFNFRPSVQNNF